MLSVSSPLASAAERGATKCRLRTTLLPRRSSQVVKPAQAGALTTPLPESCRAASSARIASRALWSAVSLAESAAFVAYEASSAASALEAWSAVMLASRLASCAATPSSAFAIFVSTSSGVSNPSTVESRAASALASALPARAASRAAVVTAPRRAVEIFESTEEVSTAESRAYAVSALASALEMVASLLASSEASAAAVTAPRRALATLVSTSSGVILAAMSRECWSTTVLRP